MLAKGIILFFALYYFVLDGALSLKHALPIVFGFFGLDQNTVDMSVCCEPHTLL